MRADWFGPTHANPVLETVRSDAHEMTSRLARIFEVQGPWVIDSPESLQACQHALHQQRR